MGSFAGHHDQPPLKPVDIQILQLIAQGLKTEDIAKRRASAFGCLAGKFPPTPDSVFFDPMPDDELAAWYGEDDNPTDPLRDPEFLRENLARKDKGEK